MARRVLVASRVLVAMAAGLLGLALAGCGAGQGALTAEIESSTRGVNATDAGVAVRNALITFQEAGYQPGEDAPVELWLVNENPEPVRLQGIASAAAASAELTEAVPVGGATGTEPPAGDGPVELALTPGQPVTAVAQLTGLTQLVDGTEAVPVTLTFNNGAVLELAVPMATPMEPLPREPMTFDEETEGH